MSKQLKTLSLEKDKFFEESKRLQILLSTKETNHDQMVKDQAKCEVTLQVLQVVTKNNFDKLKYLTLYLYKVQQGGDYGDDIFLLQ
jgi:hypothetical protein